MCWNKACMPSSLLEQTWHIKILGIWGGGREEKPTQWIDLQVREEQVVVQVEEPNNEVGQDPAERWHSTHETLIFGSVAAAPWLTVEVRLIIIQYKRSYDDITLADNLQLFWWAKNPLSLFLSKSAKTFPGNSFLNASIFCFSPFDITTHWLSLGFGKWLKQNKQLEDIALGSEQF